MAQGSQSSLFVMAVFGCFVGYILLVLTPFGGWYSYYYYGGFSATGTFGGLGAPLGMLITAVLGLPFVGCLLLCLKAIRNPAAANRRTATQALLLAVIQFSIVAVGAVAFVALVSGNDSWWFEAGFYGSAIGSVLAVICLAAVRQSLPAVAPVMAPYPGTAPYAPPPAPQGPYPPPASAGYPPQSPQAGYTPSAPAPPAPAPVAARTAPPPASSVPPPPPDHPVFAPQGGSPPAAPPPPPTPPPAPAGSYRFCVYCGTRLTASDRFCSSCGRPAA